MFCPHPLSKHLKRQSQGFEPRGTASASARQSSSPGRTGSSFLFKNSGFVPSSSLPFTLGSAVGPSKAMKLSLSVVLLLGDIVITNSAAGTHPAWGRDDLAFCRVPLIGLDRKVGALHHGTSRRNGCSAAPFLMGLQSLGLRLPEKKGNVPMLLSQGRSKPAAWEGGTTGCLMASKAASEGQEPSRSRSTRSRQTGVFGLPKGWFSLIWRRYKRKERREARQLLGWDGSGPRRQRDRSTIIYTTSPTDGSTVLVPGDYMYRYMGDTARMASRFTRRQSDEWTTNLLGIFRSRVFRRILPHIRFNVLVCCIVAAAYCAFPNTAFLPGHMHVITGSFLGLLIAFRTNAGYQRYWEARILWDKVQNTCRNLSLTLCTYCASPEVLERALSILKAYPFTLKQHLRGQRNLEEISKIVSKKDLLTVADASNMPASLCLQLSVVINPIFTQRSGGKFINVWAQMEMDIQKLMDCVGASERIAGTPVPLSYSRHTSRFLSIWSLTLPFHMVGFFHPVVLIPAYAFVCWALMGTEEVGHIIEEPFGAKPVSTRVRKDKDGSNVKVGGDLGENLPLLRYCNAIVEEIQATQAEYALLRHFEKDPAKEADSFGLTWGTPPAEPNEEPQLSLAKQSPRPQQA